MELLSKLGIDWKLLIAQIINFGILILVLGKFVYRPLLNMLNERQQKIEKGLEEAKKGEALLKQIEAIEKERKEATSREVAVMINKAMEEAERVKQDIMKEAQAQAEDLLKRAKLQTEEMKANIVKEVKSEVSELILFAMAKVLGREFSAEDQRRLEGVITQEIAA